MQASTSRLATAANVAKGKSPSTSSSSPRLVAAALLSRPPLLLPPLTPFEKSWHAWNRRLRRAISHPVAEKLYFRPSSSAQRSYLERERELASLGLLDDDGEGEPEASEEEYGEERATTDLTRKLSRTLYLLLRKDREGHRWQFRASILRFSHVSEIWCAKGFAQLRAVSRRRTRRSSLQRYGN